MFTGCYTDFNATTNIVTSGAVLYSNITNEQDCKALCVALPSCLSYQIDRTQPSSLLCWIQFTKGDRFLRLDVTEYTKFVNCPNVTGEGIVVISVNSLILFIILKYFICLTFC